MKTWSARVFWLLLFGLPGFAAEAEELSDVNDSLIVYGHCVMVETKLYATTKELPEDIITAAFGFCHQEQGAYSRALQAYYQRRLGTPNPTEVRHGIDQAEIEIRRVAMKDILQARYPLVKQP